MHNGRVAVDPITTNTSHKLLGQADKRRRLTIYPPASGTATLSNQPGVVADGGITLTAGMAPLYLDVDFHGDCVTQEWYVIYSVTGHPCAFIETLCYGDKDHAHDSPARGGKRSY